MAKRIEKLDNERWKGWDWAASNKLNEVIEAVNTLTEQVEDIVETMRYEKGLVPTQAEPDSLLEEYKKLSERALEPDTEQWQPLAGHGYWAVKANGVVEYRKNDSEADGEWFEFGNCFRYQEEAEAAAEKIRNLLRGRS